MAAVTLQRDERIGLGIAIVLHAALVAVLLVQPAKRDPAPIPERMTVSLATDVGLESTAPDPVAVSRVAVAPVLADEPAPMIEPMERAIIEPQRPVEIERPAPRPNPRAAAAPKRDRPKPRQSNAPTPKQSAAPKKSGGSRIGADFLPGGGSSTTSDETRAPAAIAGPSEKASIGQAIARQLKPHWAAPQGVDVDKLVTIIAFDLNPDGSLAGAPRFVSQTGVNDANRSQADRHKEQAIRAIRLAAPFDLPKEYYSAWKRISNARFDRNT